jgi:fatty-acyl-CoA synthase
MCYTSGTTGRPKGVVYSHRSTVLHTLMANQPDHWGLAAGDRVMPVTPMFHANSWGVPYGCAMVGAHLVFPGPHLHPEDLLALMHAERPSFVLGVPTIWLTMLQLLETQPDKYRLPPGMRMLVGGAPVPEAMIRAYARHGAEIRHGWGMTETSPVGTISFLKPELRGVGEDERFRRFAMAGVPVPLMELRIVGESGAELPWDGRQVGEVQVRGAFITGGYHEVAADPEKFTTDGVASLDEHGYLRITDRTKDLVKSGGEWISSVDMENLLMAHPAVQEAAVIAVPDAKWGERPLPCVVLKAGQAASAEELSAHLARSFARWQLPERFEFIDAIPRTSTGKFWKVKLRERFRATEAKA